MPIITPIPFGRRFLGPGYPSIIIAEIGINHEGGVNTCGLMIEAAVRAGVDAVKLQSADPDEHYMPGTESHELYTRAALKPAETAAMFELARSLNVEMLTTCGDPPTMDFIETLNPAAHKISSGMLGHLPMIRRFAASGRPLLFSSGMTELEGIDAAVNAALSHGAKHVSVMQCVSLYPAAPEAMNLRAMETLRNRFNVPVGLSDHSLGIEVATLAVAAGAHVIEKHFSLDRNRPGFDHEISLEPSELKALVQSIRRTEAIMGSGEKIMTEDEDFIRKRFARKLVARVDIPTNKTIQENDVSIMRVPLNSKGLLASNFDQIIGRRVRHTLARFAVITEDDLI